MKIAELLNEEFAEDDYDDEVVDTPSTDDDDEASKDIIPHLVMQLKKAMDVNGDHPIIFRDNSKYKLPLSVIRNFLEKYMQLKPMDRESIQASASANLDGFKHAYAAL